MSQSIKESIQNAELLGGIASWYGLRARPLAGGTTPKDHSAYFSKQQALELFPKLRHETNIRHGIVCFPRELEAREAQSFELIPLNKAKGLESEYLNSIPSNEEQATLINRLAAIINVNDKDGYAIEELEYESEKMLKKAFKELPEFSDRKPYPGWIASAPVISQAAMMDGIDR